jgi:hypothetical protein
MPQELAQTIVDILYKMLSWLTSRRVLTGGVTAAGVPAIALEFWNQFWPDVQAIIDTLPEDQRGWALLVPFVYWGLVIIVVGALNLPILRSLAERSPILSDIRARG